MPCEESQWQASSCITPWSTSTSSMNDNQQQKGKNFSGRFAWRMCLLFMFGVINVAFYDGDILMLYACYGLLLIPITIPATPSVC